jgi:hypothetical protein
MTDPNETWKQLELSYEPFRHAVDAFLKCTKDQRVTAIKANYQANRPLVILLLSALVLVEDLEELLPFLLSQAESIHGYLWAFYSIILRIPRDWLAAHIENAAEPFLRSGDDGTYRRFFELYLDIDVTLARRLAERALASSDADTREAGTDFMEKIANNPQPGPGQTSVL